ncbi:nitroreductase family protein [Kordiimonas marina]|uniref:nitroreductase family protein n=1 Tax=Kordiimonas marina TaxID=2872312 RepID=UPI001FF5DD60|nr:nitroreductase [Kordiimonas marina]MCJ9428511.1 nitroreductase [Kordiimonas marina]
MTFNSPNAETYDLLMTRRSVKAREMVGPGPDRAAMEKILAAGARVPDHGKLSPWRYIVLTGADREPLGELIARALIEENETNPAVAEKMKGYATQGPTLLVAISSPKENAPIPVWEQELSAGAACQNMLVAATALGYVGCWLTGWASYSPTVKAGLGLAEHEKIAGFIFFGNQAKAPTERPRPALEDVAQWGWPE